MRPAGEGQGSRTMHRLQMRLKGRSLFFFLVLLTVVSVALIYWMRLQKEISAIRRMASSSGRTLLTFERSSRWGIGNEMFAFASLVGIARTYADDIWLTCIDSSTHIISVFDYLDEEVPKCSAKVLREEIGANRHNEVSYARYDSAMNRLPTWSHMIIGRFLQSWKYFVDSEDELRKRIFIFRDSISRTSRRLLTDGVERHLSCRDCLRETLTIGVHVRRGNMFRSKDLRQFGYTVADADYLDRAMNYYDTRFSEYYRKVFVVCSDSIDWCRNSLQHRTDVVFVESGRPEVDMAVLSSCNHSIITVGSFGWWAAWLANGLTVYYKNWPVEGSILASHTNHEDYFPPHWIGM